MRSKRWRQHDLGQDLIGNVWGEVFWVRLMDEQMREDAQIRGDLLQALIPGESRRDSPTETGA